MSHWQAMPAVAAPDGDAVAVQPPMVVAAPAGATHMQTAPRRGLSARADTEWIAYTPLAAHTLATARHVTFGADGPFAAAVVGVYGSGKSTLLFTLMREALAKGHLPVWEEAAAFVARLLPDDEAVLPQQFVARVLTWLESVATDSAERAGYLTDLERRGRGDVAAKLRGAQSQDAATVVLLLDEVEQAHQLLQRRIATDDGQPLRALIDACGPQLRLILAYAPESYHTLGDADRGRLVTLPVPPMDVGAIQATYKLPRGHANFAWWASRGRTRGVDQVVHGVLEPWRRGLFEADLTALGDAIDALPGVFGVPALLRDGVDHRRLRELIDLRPQPSDLPVGGVVCHLADRRRLADTIRRELARRLGPLVDLEPLANEVVAVLEAVADDDGRVYLTLDDFGAALRVAEARVIESGRVREPITRLVDEGARIFDSLGDLGPLPQRLAFSLRELADERFPSPFTDPFVPLGDGRVPAEVDLERAFRPLAAQPGPLLASVSGGFSVFADSASLARHVRAFAFNPSAEPLRALLIEAGQPLVAILEFAQFAGRLAVVEVGKFHATFLKCLALRARTLGLGSDLDALVADSGADRQLGRKIGWHRDRLTVLVRDVRPRADGDWQAATAYIRQNESFRSTLARLDRDSPALLGLLLALRPLGPAERALCVRMATLLAEGSPLRRLAREANPGGRLSGAAVVIDGLLPAAGRTPRWTEQSTTGTRELGRVLERFAASADLRPQLAAWLYAEDRARLEVLLHYHAGALPDVAREVDALDALRRLDETARRAAAVVADLQRCTGRRQAPLTALRLGTFTDQVRAQAAPVDQLRQLAADVQELAATGTVAWLRALALWICGVIAARLLKGVEKEQAGLADWERIAASGADWGRRADEVQATLAAVGAHRCVDMLRHKRAQLANLLDSAATAARGLEEMRIAVGALAPLAEALEAARTAFRDRGIAIDEAVEAYLPEIDQAGAHRALLRRVPEILHELGGDVPRPAARTLMDYLELLRQHAETTRHNRLRLRLEDLLTVTLPGDLRVHPDEVAAIEAAWAVLAQPTRQRLQAELQRTVVFGADELRRWIAGCAEKLAIVAAWGDPGHHMLAAIDADICLWSEGLRVSTDDVREATRARVKAVGWVHNLRGGLLSPEVVDHLIAAYTGTPDGRAYAAIVEAARAVDEQLTILRERYVKLAGQYPVGALSAATADEALVALDALCAAKREQLEAELARLRQVSALLSQVGERPAPVAAELSVLAAARVADRETERLQQALQRQWTALVAWLATVELPPTLAPPPCSDLGAWFGQLREANQHADELRSQLRLADRLGLRVALAADLDWQQAHASLHGQLARAQEALRGLVNRHAELVDRCRRLGGQLQPATGALTTMDAAQAQVDVALAQIEQLRQQRLASASDPARAVYAAVLAGGGPELPAAVAELVKLGLLRTVEDGQ